MENNLDLERLRELTDELDIAVPRDGAWLRDGESEEGTLITANRNGYFRLGIEFLKTALAELPGKSESSQEGQVEVDLDYLVGEEICYEFVRREEVLPDSSPAAMGFVGTALSVSLVLMFLASLAVGIITILRWLIGVLI